MADTEAAEVKTTSAGVDKSAIISDEAKVTTEGASVPTSKAAGKAPATKGGAEEAKKPTSSSTSPGEKGASEEKKRQRKRPSPKKDGAKKDEQHQQQQQQEEKGDQKESKDEGDADEDGSKADDDAKDAATNSADSPRVKKAPYFNPDRFKTGGQQKEKLSDEALVERMERIRLNNEKIKERRLTVEADEQAFRASQEVIRQKQVTERQIQDSINRSREQNAQRKMEKIQGREWDSEKSPRGGGPQSGPVSGRGRGAGRGGSARNQTATTTAAASPAGQAEGANWNTKTPVVRTPAKANEASSPTRSSSLTRDAPPHTAPTPAAADVEQTGWS